MQHSFSFRPWKLVTPAGCKDKCNERSSRIRAARMSLRNAPGAKVDLYGSWFCPFVQRAWMALEAKGVPYNYVEIDPYNKTPEFLALNPRGLVPTLKVKEGSIYESTVLLEYIDEAFDTPHALFPSDPFRKAQERIWIDFVNKQIVPCVYKSLVSQEKEVQQTVMQSLVSHVKELFAVLPEGGVKFLMGGDRLSAVDCMLAPFVWRFGVLEHYRGFRLPEEGPEFEKYRAWKKEIEATEAFKATMCDFGKLIGSYERYANNTAKTKVADAVRTGSALP